MIVELLSIVSLHGPSGKPHCQTVFRFTSQGIYPVFKVRRNSLSWYQIDDILPNSSCHRLRGINSQELALCVFKWAVARRVWTAPLWRFWFLFPCLLSDRGGFNPFSEMRHCGNLSVMTVKQFVKRSNKRWRETLRRIKRSEDRIRKTQELVQRWADLQWIELRQRND